MLELYKACPKCGTHAKAEADKCEKCGQILGPKAVPKARKRFDVLIGIVVVAIAIVFIFKPDAITRLWAKGEPEVEVVKGTNRPVWKFPGNEPPARFWAHPVEKSLIDNCIASWTRHSDPKYLTPTLNFQLMGGNAVASKATAEECRRTKTPLPHLEAEEIADALGTIGDHDKFVADCLTRGYKLMEPCEKFKKNIVAPEAQACLVPPVESMLKGLAFRICTTNAKTARVKALCEVAAERMEAYVAPPPAAPKGT